MKWITALAFAILLVSTGCTNTASNWNSQEVQFANACIATEDVRDMRFRVFYNPILRLTNPTATFRLAINKEALPGAGSYKVRRISSSQTPEGRAVSTFKLIDEDAARIQPSWDEARSWLIAETTRNFAILIDISADHTCIECPFNPDPEIWTFTKQLYNAKSGQVFGEQVEEW